MSHTTTPRIHPAARIAAVVLTLAVLFAGGLLHPTAASAAPGKGKGTERTGQEAIDFLGDRLAKVAKDLHLKPAKLEKMLRTDTSLKIDDKGKALFVENEPEQAVTSGLATYNVSTAPYAYSQTFALHSRPNSPRKIYLDFNGHTTSGTSWNSSYRNGYAFTTPAFDLDGNPGSFNVAEHIAIQVAWLAVREDFAAFNVDVTTQDPGLENLRRTTTSDAYYGQRVVVGANTWYPYSAGGVGYVGSFSWNNDTPVYVFTHRQSYQKFIAEAASHEVGHAVGLSHDGTTTGHTYYGGHGDWAPIMGSSYGRDVTQWSRGQYAYANNTQDDMSIIAGHTGWVYDDYYGNTSTGATLPAGTRRYGSVNWAGDVDAFRFSLTGTRSVKISAWGNTGPIDPNLNIRLTLRNSAGTLLAVSNPADIMHAGFTKTLGAGTYYVYVDGVGEGSPWNTGFSNYGSHGFFGVVLNWA